VLLADRVALLADGAIVAQGTHAELLDTEPAYRDLMTGPGTGPDREDTGAQAVAR
jgi:ATP-binding cassette, subfamily B, bacterial